MTQFTEQNAKIHSVKSLLKVNKDTTCNVIPSSTAFNITLDRVTRAFQVE